ncbi:MAG: family 16 glycoside hydrolase [Ktedonobacteraceae bacterium]
MNVGISIVIAVGDVVVVVMVLVIAGRYLRRRSSVVRKIGVGVICLVLVGAAIGISVIYWPRPTAAYGLSSADRAALLKTYGAVTSGNPMLYDSLRAQDENQWDTGTWRHGDSCSFHDGAYHIKSVEKSYYSWCIAEVPTFHNFAFQVRMRVVEGDGGGLVFRSEGKSGNYYYFHVGQDGSYGLAIFVAKGQETDVLTGTSASVITGVGETNLLCVIVRGNDIALYVNRQPVAEFTDTSYQRGQVGVVADEDNDTTDVAYSNAQVWVL